MKRITKQRKAIFNSFQKISRPLSIEEIVSIVSQTISEINLSTVYRNVKALVEEGVIRTVELPGNPPRYELATQSHHHHFLCFTCNRLYEIAGCPSDIFSLVPKGFNMVSHSITLKGYCKECVSRSKS